MEMTRRLTTHPSGKKLYEVADYTLDNCGVMGDAIVDLPGKEQSAGPTSTMQGPSDKHSANGGARDAIESRR